MPCKLTHSVTPGGEASHLLTASHERFCACLDTLGKLALWVAEHGADAPARQAAATVLRRFRGEAARHCRDEEEHVFPRLLVRADADERPQVARLINVLAADHRHLRAAWDGLVERLEAVAAGATVALDGADVRDFMLKLCGHIECEQTQLLPLMQRLLADEDHTEIGFSLRTRAAADALARQVAGAAAG